MKAIGNISFDQIYLINLPEREDRLKNALRNLNKANITATTFEAVNGKAIDHKAVSAKHSPGMVGCFLSHHNIYKNAIERDFQTIAVFEDDAELCPGFDYFAPQALAEIPSDWQFAFLGFHQYRGFHAFRKVVNDYWAIPSFGWGTQCYIVRGKDTIQTLYEQTQKMNMQIDEQLIQEILPERIVHYMVYPNLIRQSEELGTDVQPNKQLKL